jgi:SAM-dependent methyltransferase
MLTNEPTVTPSWNLAPGTWNCLSPYEKSFFENEYKLRTIDYYVTRLKQLGFVGQTRVLDAGCGLGQWSIAMSRMNSSVLGLDISMHRLLLARELASSAGCNNVEFRYGSAEELPVDGNSLDAVFCYGVFMFTDMQRCLSEIYRVLRPGGLAYVNANSFGWYLHMLIDRGLKKGNLPECKAAARMLLRGLTGQRRMALVTRDRMNAMVRNAGLLTTKFGLEGRLIVAEQPEPVPPAYASRHFGFASIWEYLLVKP